MSFDYRKNDEKLDAKKDFLLEERLFASKKQDYNMQMRISFRD